jgi:excisionase family DNA binding protein
MKIMDKQQFIEAVDHEKLINGISERVTANILEAVKNGQPGTDNPERLLTIDEIAELLHLTKPTIYSKVSKNELPGVCKQGKRLYFDRQIIIDWIKQGRKKSNAEIKQSINKQSIKEYLLNNRKGLNNEK